MNELESVIYDHVYRIRQFQYILQKLRKLRRNNNQYCINFCKHRQRFGSSKIIRDYLRSWRNPRLSTRRSFGKDFISMILYNYIQVNNFDIFLKILFILQNLFFTCGLPLIRSNTKMREFFLRSCLIQSSKIRKILSCLI